MLFRAERPLSISLSCTITAATQLFLQSKQHSLGSSVEGTEF